MRCTRLPQMKRPRRIARDGGIKYFHLGHVILCELHFRVCTMGGHEVEEDTLYI